jgi:hypothetical protein
VSCAGTSNCDCGCCAGTSVQTPQPEFNPAGRPAVAYRAGVWSSFKESMLARLSSSDYPALAALKTRDNDDFTIALLDATAIVLDILTFYQERLANESYLRTAVQPRSLTELSRLIGYQPAPGVSASTYLAFTLKTTPGQPVDPTARSITIPKGTQVQSVPAQGQKPQTFETSSDIQAKADWTSLQVQTGRRWAPAAGDTSIYLAGTSTQIQPGDAILIVGDERVNNPLSAQWDLRIVTTVQVDGQNDRTRLTWAGGLGSGNRAPARSNPKFFALRQRAALFGYNALYPQLLDTATINTLGVLLAKDGDWNFANNSPTSSPTAVPLIDLDSTYPKIVPQGWTALIDPGQPTGGSPSGLVSLYQVLSVTTIARSGFGLSSKISRVRADVSTNIHSYYTHTRDTSALVQSELMGVPEQPLGCPLYGYLISLETLRTDLAAVQVVALSGKRQKIAVVDSATVTALTAEYAANHNLTNPLQFHPDDGAVAARTLLPNELLTLTDPTPLPPPAPGAINPGWTASAISSLITLSVEDANGTMGTITSALAFFTLAPSDKSDPDVGEYALVSKVDSATDPAHTLFSLQNPLTHCYERASATLNANVAPATHGQTVGEIMGGGSAAQPNQSFTLKQSPLTCVQAPTPNGRQTTLQVQAGGTAWTEVPTLYNQGSSRQVYATLFQAGASTDVLFGDGVEGATLPTGQNNIQASYRIGLGATGNVGAGALTTLMDRPLGVSGVTNPEPATGGQDPQSLDDIRSNAPLTVLTLGRAVSITDYQNYASSFAGIAKAYCIWIPGGPARGVFLTVAGIGGAALLPPNPTLTNLATSLQNYGNPLVPIHAQSFVETLFGLAADVWYDPAANQPAAQALVLQTLQQAFGFNERTFGQGVSVDEVAAVIQGVPGVAAVNVKKITPGPTSAGGDLASQTKNFGSSALHGWNARLIPSFPRPFSDSATRICPYLPMANPQSQSWPYPAEILVLDPDPANVILGVMS